MRYLTRILPILLVTVLVVTSTIIGVQASTKPSTPQFTLKINTYTYDVAPESTVNPYTGETTSIQSGYHVEYKAIDVVIQNQPGDDVYYVVQFKGHYTGDWTTYCAPIPNSMESEAWIHQSKGDTTIISVPINSDAEKAGTPTNFPAGSKVEFRVKAEKGTFEEAFGGLDPYLKFIGEGSDFSTAQDITMPIESTGEITPDPTTAPNNPTSEPTTNGNQPQGTDNVPLTTFAAVILAFVVIIVILTGVLLTRKHKQ